MWREEERRGEIGHLRPHSLALTFRHLSNDRPGFLPLTTSCARLVPRADVILPLSRQGSVLLLLVIDAFVLQQEVVQHPPFGAELIVDSLRPNPLFILVGQIPTSSPRDYLAQDLSALCLFFLRFAQWIDWKGLSVEEQDAAADA